MHITSITPIKVFFNNFSKKGNYINELVKTLKSEGYDTFYKKPLKNGKVALSATGGDNGNYFFVLDFKNKRQWQKTMRHLKYFNIFGTKSHLKTLTTGNLKGDIELSQFKEKVYENGQLVRQVIRKETPLYNLVSTSNDGKNFVDTLTKF